MNHTPLIHSKPAMTLVTIALSCPFAQAGTGGYLSTSSAAGTSVVGPTAVYEGQTPQAAQDDINLRQISLRQEKTREAMRLLQEGRTAYADGRYKEALDKYQAAWDAIPKAPATQRKQEFIIASIGDASIAVAIEYAKVARYDDAEQLLQDVLLRDPNNRRARHELSMLRDPVRNNPANTPENVRNVQEVQRLLELSHGYYDLGKYDDAYAEANRVLEIDPYNSAARRLQEQCSRRKSTYYTSARDAHRAKMLAAVDATWEEALPVVGVDLDVGGGSVAAPVSAGQLKNEENLEKIHIEEIKLENQTVEEALNILRGEAVQDGVNINFLYVPLKKTASAPAPAPAISEDEEDEEAVAAPAPVEVPATTPEFVTIDMQNVSGKFFLQTICRLTGCSVRVGDGAVEIYQAGADQGEISMRRWKVAPSFFNTDSGEGDAGEDDEESGFAAEEESPKRGKRLDPLASLKAKGAQLTAKGSSARYDRATNMLTVYGTQDDLDMVEESVNEFRQKMPRMVKVSSKFMEVAQTNEEELSFDWVVNPFSVSNNGNVYLGGVNAQNSNPVRTISDFVSSGGSAYASNYKGDGAWPISGSNNILTSSTDPIGNGLMTGGLRTGTGAIAANSMDALLTAGSAAVSSSKQPAPGILSLSGIYDDGSFQAIMRGLSQKKGVDIMSAPSLVLSPGDVENVPDVDPLSPYQNDDGGSAKIEVIRRFVYPSEYEAPEIDAGGSTKEDEPDWSTGGVPVASPANPSSWAVDEVGIVMRVKVVGNDAQMSDVIEFNRFEIRVVGFEGFVNYGSPITVGVTAGNRIEHITLTDNRIDMPIFSRRFINSNPKIYDGHTIAIGGLIEDNVQKVEDKVPVFGDLPLVGRFFRSEAESHVRKNLMIFVTAEYIDPTGKPIRHRDVGTSDAPTAGTSAPSLFPDEGLANP